MSEDLKRISRNYDRVCSFYERVAQIYSTNQIPQSKSAQLQHIQPGQSILYLGVGAGEDAIEAAKLGAKVTCVDISQKMINSVRRKLDKYNLSAELICASAMAHEQFYYYDIVATNYFLNCFRERQMYEALYHAVRLLKPDGKLMIADVATAQGTLFSKSFNVLYLKFAMVAFWTIGLVPLHRNYDYTEYFVKAGLELEQVEYFRLFKKGPVLFQNIVAKKRFKHYSDTEDSIRSKAEKPSGREQKAA